MNRYALITNNSVDLIVEADSIPTAWGSWVDVTGLDVGPMDLYDGVNFTKYVPPPLPNIITKEAFRLRFTNPEYTGIVVSSKTDAEVQAWYDTYNTFTKFDLDSQDTKDGIADLVSKNLLTQLRANEILAVPVQPHERFQ